MMMMNTFLFTLLIIFVIQQNILSYHFNNPKLIVNQNKIINNKLSSTTILQSSTSSWSPASVVKKPQKKVLVSALLNYVAATTVQWSLIVGFLHFLQLKVIDNLKNISIITNMTSKFINPDTISTAIVTIFMLFMSVRSRVFSPLTNTRPKASANDPVFKYRRRPGIHIFNIFIIIVIVNIFINIHYHYLLL
jgi:hypothetical protein